ncbi:MAG: YciI family protein [Planctomycetota bacterium]
MPKFLFIYRDPVEKTGPELTADEMQANMNQWWEWLGQGQQDGWVVAMGDPLTPDGRVVGSNKSVTDGPYAESKELVGGYSIIQATDFEEACQHAMGCPIYAGGGNVEVRQIMEAPAPE